MATVHVGRLLGPVGFARTVAIKRLHPQYARDPEFVSMFLDEARMCARIRHPNVVPTLDVVATQGELFLVMEYVQGESLAQLVRGAAKRGRVMPWKVAIAIVAGMLQGLHAAHEAKDERGFPLGLVHRDVSPHNVLVGVDGMARVVDFGIAKASGRLHTTREGAVKGKLGYMAPEQMAAENVTRQADLYAGAVVLWETLTGTRLFDADTEAVVLAKVLTGEVKPPSSVVPGIPPELDAIVMKGLSRKVSSRYETGREFATALEKLGPSPLGEVGDWVEETAEETLGSRARLVTDIENGSGGLTPMPAPESDRQTEVPEPPSTAQSGSIRPTALSDAQIETALPVARPKPPKWIIVAIGAGLAASVLGAWAITAPSGAEPSTAASATSPVPAATATATATVTEVAPTPSVSAPAVVASAAPTADAAASSSAEAASSSAPKRWGKLPTPTHTSSPFNLGGRN